jgi:hypothetical protein
MKILKCILLVILAFTCSCTRRKPTSDSVILDLDQLINHSSKYATQLVDVSGEISMDYHGPLICSDKGSPCLFIVLPENVVPKPDFELMKDNMYEKYEKLSIEIGIIQKQLGNSRLMATLRGKLFLFAQLPDGKEVLYQSPKMKAPILRRFVLQRVLKLDIQRIK